MKLSKSDFVKAFYNEYKLDKRHIEYIYININEPIEITEMTIVKDFVKESYKYAFNDKARKFCKDNKTNYIEDEIVLDWLIEYVNKSTDERKEFDIKKENKTKGIENKSSVVEDPNIEKGQMSIFDA